MRRPLTPNFGGFRQLSLELICIAEAAADAAAWP